MALVFADRVKETTTTTGTGTVSLAGAATGYRTFVSGVGTGNTCYYCITAGSEWETGIGTVTSGSPDTLSRTTVFASSNSGSLVTFSAGTKDVFLTVPANYFTYNITDPWINLMRANGSVLFAQTFPPQYMATTSALTAAQTRLHAIYIPYTTVLTGVKWFQTTVGVYTANNNNKIGLYTQSGGTFTKVAESTTDGTLWSVAGANAMKSKAFSSTYTAQPGFYWIAMIYCSSAQTTAPALGAATGVSTAAMQAADMTNSVALTMLWTTQTDLSATLTAASGGANTTRSWFAVY